jgi:signal transduction histidine kinase
MNHKLPLRWHQSPTWVVLLETVAGSLLFATGLWYLRLEMSSILVGQGLMMLTAVSGVWAALRWRAPVGRRWLPHLTMALLLGAGLGGIYYLTLSPLGWGEFLDGSPLKALGLGLTLSGTGLVFLGFRLLMAAVSRWSIMRRQRLRWSIVHAHLIILIAIFGVWGITLFIAALNSTVSMAELDLATSLMGRLIVTIFPAVAVAGALAVFWVAVLFFPLTLFSWWITRPLTARLERLTAGTTALRAGDLGIRVDVEGEDELSALQADFNAMAESLEDARRELGAERDRVTTLLEDRRELMAKVSHELRTPVSVLASQLEVAADGDGVDPTRLTLLRGEVERLDRLIDDLFTLARAETRSLEVSPEPVDLTRILTRVCSGLKPLAWRSRKVELICAPPAELPQVLADGARLEQIIINLIRNGVEHTPPGGLVSVEVKLTPGAPELQLIVADTGEGIAAEDIPRIWDRFWSGPRTGSSGDGENRPGAGPRTESRNGIQEDSAGVRRPGAGLGLTLVKELAGAMGASLAVTSTPGQGSRFTVTLPLA